MKRAGYSLLEMSVVLLILSILAAMFLSVSITVRYNEKAKITAERMEAVQKALVWFRQSEFRLPCPADGALSVASVNHGREGACTNTGGVRAGGNLAVGVVPTKTLGLADDYMHDGWGRKMTYAVDTRAAGDCAFTDYDSTDTTVGFTVDDEAGDALQTRAWYAIISHGHNGHGAFATSGARVSSGSVNTNEHLNCHCDDEANNTALGGVFVAQSEATEAEGDPKDRFDDMVVYGGRRDIRSTADEDGTTETCP